jgi:UDP-N-acetylglucosamine 2-epimerase (non-hydrolysing)
VEVIFPVHLNPRIREIAYEYLGDKERVHIIEPLEYEPFTNLMAKAYLILTDSGGIQEEAPSLGKPVLVLRAETERPEAIDAGTVKLVGTEYENVFNEAKLLIDNEAEYEKMAFSVNPYGDGKASGRIVYEIKQYFI